MIDNGKEIFGRWVESKLFGPKDYFERQKRRYSLWFSGVVLGGIVAPAFVASGLVIAGNYEVEPLGQSSTAKGNIVVNALSNDYVVPLFCLIAVLIAFTIIICMNLSYSAILVKRNDSIVRIITVDEARDNFSRIKALLLDPDVPHSKESEVALLTHIKDKFPEFFSMDADLIKCTYKLGLMETMFPPSTPVLALPKE